MRLTALTRVPIVVTATLFIQTPSPPLEVMVAQRTPAPQLRGIQVTPAAAQTRVISTTAQPVAQTNVGLPLPKSVWGQVLYL